MTTPDQSLRSQIEKACAHDERDIHEQALRMGYNSTRPSEYKAFEYGAKSEHARLRPLLQLLGECAEALENMVINGKGRRDLLGDAKAVLDKLYNVCAAEREGSK